MFDAQGGVCFCGCGQPLGSDYIAEHWTPVALGNRAKPDCLMHKSCAKRKTYGGAGRIGGDIRDIAHIKRLRDRRTQYDKRAERGPLLRSGKKLEGRGFQTLHRRKFDGTVEPRRDR